MKLIVGLGNPGDKYENNRHNIGFKVIDELKKNNECSDYREKFQGLLSEIKYKDDKILLLKPQTYMNLSGNSVNDVVKFFKLNPKLKGKIPVIERPDLDVTNPNAKKEELEERRKIREKYAIKDLEME